MTMATATTTDILMIATQAKAAVTTELVATVVTVVTVVVAADAAVTNPVTKLIVNLKKAWVSQAFFLPYVSLGERARDVVCHEATRTLSSGFIRLSLHVLLTSQASPSESHPVMGW